MSGRTSLNLSTLTLIAGLGLAAMAPAQSAGNAAAGGRAWTQEHPASDDPKSRSCATCHTADLTKPGKAVASGKVIEPMAVSVNPERLKDPEKVEKWFRRNCHWTLGRACTPEEKADFLAYIQSR